MLDDLKRRLKREILEIEVRTDLTQDQKVEHVIRIGAVVCASVAAQPVPFADMLTLPTLQGYLASRLAAIRGVFLSEFAAITLVRRLTAIVGTDMLARQAGMAATKVLLPGIGGFAAAPMVYRTTEGVGRVMDCYLSAEARGRSVSVDALRGVWETSVGLRPKAGAERPSATTRFAKAGSATS